MAGAAVYKGGEVTPAQPLHFRAILELSPILFFLAINPFRHHGISSYHSDAVRRYGGLQRLGQVPL